MEDKDIIKYYLRNIKGYPMSDDELDKHDVVWYYDNIIELNAYKSLYSDLPCINSPQMISRDYIGTHFNEIAMIEWIKRCNNYYREHCDNVYLKEFYNKPNHSVFTMDYEPDVHEYVGIDHFDFAQLYPHIVKLIADGSTYDNLTGLLNKSIAYKDKNHPCHYKRPIVKLLLNSYWGLVACSDELFKLYMLSMERYIISYCIVNKIIDPIFVKTDGIYGYNLDVDKLYNMTDTLGWFRPDVELNQYLYKVNVSNYITLDINLSPTNIVGYHFRNTLTGRGYTGLLCCDDTDDWCIRKGSYTHAPINTHIREFNKFYTHIKKGGV